MDLASLMTIGNALTIGATAANDGNSQFSDIGGGLASVEGAITIRYNSAAATEKPRLAAAVGVCHHSE